MEIHRVDDLIRLRTASLRSLVGSVLTLATGWFGLTNVDGTKRKRTSKKAKLYAFGCSDVGKPCGGNSELLN
jgi:hypothetical protein